ncbi:hypothetical protein OL229_04880 [Neisseriaceae bacterium JH1-16]|nr:hypothetical protein [Neisseriaceae bacterium JH1-16]
MKIHSSLPKGAAMIESHKHQVADLLRSTLKLGSTIHYSQLYDLFDDLSAEEFGGANLRMAAIHQTLEAAALDLAETSDAIVTCVLRTKTGLPGLGFFDVFHIHRHAEYKAIAGNTIVQELTDAQKFEMLELERQRAYDYAKKHLK